MKMTLKGGASQEYALPPHAAQASLTHLGVRYVSKEEDQMRWLVLILELGVCKPAIVSISDRSRQTAKMRPLHQLQNGMYLHPRREKAEPAQGVGVRGRTVDQSTLLISYVVPSTSRVSKIALVGWNSF